MDELGFYRVGEHSSDGVLRGCVGGPRLAIGATIWAWRLGRGHRVAGSSPLSSDCTAVHVLLCIPSREMVETGCILIKNR